MSEARALFAGPGARRAVVVGRQGTVELVLRRGACVRLGSDWLTLTAPRAPFGPLSVAVSDLDRLALRPGTPALVEPERLVLGRAVVSFARTHARGALAIPPAAEPPELMAAAAAAQAGLPCPPARLRPGLLALLGARCATAVRLLAGLGDGLTPAGDDVLAGYAAARVALAAPVTLSGAAVSRSSGLGLAYLRCAERGELPDVAARVLVAICRGSAVDARAALPPLREWGSSSGVALAWGINAAVMSLN